MTSWCLPVHLTPFPKSRTASSLGKTREGVTRRHLGPRVATGVGISPHGRRTQSEWALCPLSTGDWMGCGQEDGVGCSLCPGAKDGVSRRAQLGPGPHQSTYSPTSAITNVSLCPMPGGGWIFLATFYRGGNRKTYNRSGLCQCWGYRRTWPILV